ncbi:MAG: glucose 1-dehydrogenase [Nitratireductor sp.]|nr:glucose 1-dehydrogenase [Nitratireductor sp.]
MTRCSGKIAMVTGAGKGLGQAACMRLAEAGARLICTDIEPALAARTAEGIRAAGGEAVSFEHDVADPVAWDTVMEAALAHFGGLDVMVNNAGIAIAANIETTSIEQWRRTMAVDLDSVFYGCKAAIATMKGRGGGSIINLSSIDGVIGEAELAAYCAAKGGVRTLTKSVAVHCGERGYRIRCNSIHPGYIMTPQTEGYLRDLGAFDEEVAAATRRHPIGCLGEPDDVAMMVVYLASDEAKFVTGAEMVVDGGYLAV